MVREYAYPVYGTQGGGLAREVGGKLIFVEKPDCPGLEIGDEVPEEWGVAPANRHARRVIDEEGLSDDDKVYLGIFETLVDGRMKWEDAAPFIPSRLHEEVRRALGIDK